MKTIAVIALNREHQRKLYEAECLKTVLTSQNKSFRKVQQPRPTIEAHDCKWVFLQVDDLRSFCGMRADLIIDCTNGALPKQMAAAIRAEAGVYTKV